MREPVAQAVVTLVVTTAGAVTGAGLRGFGLTGREAEVLLARGASNAEIGRALDVSPHAVRKHLERIYRKLGVRSRTGAVCLVHQRADVAERGDRVGTA